MQRNTTGVPQPRWAIWREIWKFSCSPSLLYCISRKTLDTEYMYYSWCITSTDIVKWRKTKNFGKRGEEETISMAHAPVFYIRYISTITCDQFINNFTLKYDTRMYEIQWIFCWWAWEYFAYNLFVTLLSFLREE